MEDNSNTISLGRRDASRLITDIPAEIKINENQIHLTTITNLNETGAEISLSYPLDTSNMKLNFNLFTRVLPFSLESKIITEKKINDKYIYGLRFEKVRKAEYTGLKNFLINMPSKPTETINRRNIASRRKNTINRNIENETRTCTNRRRTKQFFLYIDGKNCDTGQYEYYPYQHKMWTEPRETLRVIVQAKKGIWKEEFDEYIYAKYCIGNDEINQKAILSAHEASKIFKKFSLAARRKIFDDIYKLLLEHKQQLVDLMVIEGHPVKLAEWEFLGMKSAYERETLNFFKQSLRNTIHKSKNENVYIVRKADGVVCVSPPKNAPCSNSFLGVFSLLSGNSVIVKPPLKTPLSTIYLWKNVVLEALKKNGAPLNSINIVLGNSKKIMDTWLGSPYINDIFYFGESDRGLEIGCRAYEKGKKAVLELSGNDMLFVWKDADIDKAVESLLDGLMGSTQICMIPKKAFIHELVYEQFLSKFIAEAKKIKPFLPEDDRAVLSPVLKQEKYFNFLNDALSKGAKLFLGGYKVNLENQKDEKGIFIAPTVMGMNYDDCLNMQCVKEENFFPLIPLVKVTGLDDKEIFNKMTNISNMNDYGLRTSVWVASQMYIKKFAKELSNSGLLRINSRHVAFSIGLSTHGGTAKSGGPYGEMNYVWQKTSHLQGISITLE